MPWASSRRSVSVSRAWSCSPASSSAVARPAAAGSGRGGVRRSARPRSAGSRRAGPARGACAHHPARRRAAPSTHSARQAARRAGRSGERSRRTPQPGRRPYRARHVRRRCSHRAGGARARCGPVSHGPFKVAGGDSFPLHIARHSGGRRHRPAVRTCEEDPDPGCIEAIPHGYRQPGHQLAGFDGLLQPGAQLAEQHQLAVPVSKDGAVDPPLQPAPDRQQADSEEAWSGGWPR